MSKLAASAAALVLAALPALAQDEAGTGGPAGDRTVAAANMIDREGRPLGSVALVETPNGVLIQPKLDGLPPGMHGFHIHEAGSCEPPAFESAGGHYNPAGAKHGLLSPDGAHAGDLPNAHVGADGVLEGDLLAHGVTLGEDAEATLFPEGGTALVIHAMPDDYETDPAGDSGDRIACGVIERPRP